LRVLFVTSTFPRGDADDQVPWLRELALALSDRGVDLEVLAPTYRGLRDHTVDGLPVHRYRYWPDKEREVVTHEAGAMNNMVGRRELALPAFALVGAGMAAAARLARKERYDVIHSHWPLPMGLLSETGARASGGPRPHLAATFHGAELALARRKGHYRPVLRGLARNLDVAIANSSHTASSVRELTGVEATVVPFGPPRGAVSFDRGDDGTPPDDGLPVVLSVGRMIERKGFPVLVRAAARLRGRARVVIVGGGEYEDVVRREVERAGVGDVVRLAGRLPNGELANLYRRCAVFCLPAIVDSRGETEGLGVVLIEAMSHGRPVVASRSGGIVDAVEDGGTGLLVPPGDEASLAGALLRLLDDPPLARKLGEAGRERARRLFSWEAVAGRHLELYRGATGRESGA